MDEDMTQNGEIKCQSEFSNKFGKHSLARWYNNMEGNWIDFPTCVAEH